ncbi:MAG: IS1634 family transposase [Porphyromonadaceae bacterium]|nr:IS1634 family transposase [Porphyromonadaceae bacterium]
MATIQQKKVNGHKYWYIVESRRVNGKPRPIMLEYLGKADDLLRRLQGSQNGIKLKSYTHGSVAALLSIAEKLDVCQCINKYIKASKPHMADKPIRNHLTAGATLMLAALGRACIVTSKESWSDWARTTSLEYMLRLNFSKIDSQHFWDMMDAMPESAIEKVESEILQNVAKIYPLDSDTLFYDTTNYYTFINTTNEHSSLAKRGKNKQKRSDLKQIGLALVVTRKDMIPLFHHTYEGNMNDSKVFKAVVGKIKDRLTALGMNLENHTLVFDRGNNSKKNLELLQELGIHYVGALTPYHHKELVEEASSLMQDVSVNGKIISACKLRKTIWGREMTVVVSISDRLKEGQIRGIYSDITSCEHILINLNASFLKGRSRKRSKEQVEHFVQQCLKKYQMSSIISYTVNEVADDNMKINYQINYDNLASLEEDMGFRILMTDRHSWEMPDIIKAYHGQSFVENTFKNMKNQQHLAFHPQYHWTDHKIKIHNFYCVLGYLMSSLIWKQAREKAGFTGTLDSLFNTLGKIRLGSILEDSGSKGRPKAAYMLETTDELEDKLLSALEITEYHKERVTINALGVYN